MKILIVDDSRAMIGLSEIVLKEAGHECHSCASPREAIALLMNERFDLILMDIRFPDEDTDGIYAAEVIKKKIPEQKIVGVSSYSSSFPKQRSMDCFDDMLTKPVTPNELKRISEVAE